MKNKIINLIDDAIEELDKDTIAGILEIPPKEDIRWRSLYII